MSTTTQVLDTSAKDQSWIAWSAILFGLIALVYFHVLKALALNW